MPQDNWFFVKTIGTNGPTSDQLNSVTGLALSRSNHLYVADMGNNRIQVFDRDGNLLFRWGASGTANGQFNSPGAICIDTNDQVYVCDVNNNRVQVFDLQGNYRSKWSASKPTGMAYSPWGNVLYVADNQNLRINSYSNGVVTQSWGSSGTLPAQFNDLRAVAVGPGVDGPLYILNYRPWQEGSSRLQLFSKKGDFIRLADLGSSGGRPNSRDLFIGVGQDGKVFSIEANTWVGSAYGTLMLLTSDLIQGEALFESLHCQAFVEGNDGRCYLGSSIGVGQGYNGIRVYQRAYRTVQASNPPIPSLLGTKQRPGTTYVDVDYRIVDGDSTNVEVAAVALVNGTLSLSQAQMMKTFVEGTSANIGTNMLANRDYRLTWNAGADWSTNFGNIKICILANDGRGLMDNLFLHIPANGANAALTISRDPVTEAEMLNCWLWLVAKGDPAITLVNGQVKSGSTVLASGTTTTAQGRAFLFARMGVREASASELQYVREAGTPGVVHQWTPRYQVGPGRWPQTVNPWGFDTGSSGWWVVKL